MNPNAAVFVPSHGWHDASAAAAPVAAAPGAVAAAADTDLVESKADGERAVVATEAELRRVLQRLDRERLICVDCEGADLSKGSWRDGQLLADPAPLHGQLCLLQISTDGGEAFAIDIWELGPRAFDLGLRRLLEDNKVLKVVHDFRQDADALWHQHRVRVRGVFDCQLCDVFIRRLGGHRTAYVQGSAKLLKAHGIEAGTVPGYGLLTQDQKLRIHARFSEERHLWEGRPLPPDMVQYAIVDVLPLPRLYRRLLADIAQLLGGNKALALQLVSLGSDIYDSDFVSRQNCCCRLCCNAEENARFDGCRVLSQMVGRADPRVMEMLWRPEDYQLLSDPGPSRFYIDEHDESQRLPVTSP